MKKFVFFSLPGHGHINPTLAVASELAKKGHTVLYYATTEFKEKIKKSGVMFRDYAVTKEFDPRVSTNISDFTKLLIDTSCDEMPQVLRLLKNDKPDCIVHDTMAMWGKVGAQITNTPAISLSTTFAFNNTILFHYPQMAIPMVIKGLLKGNIFISALQRYKKMCNDYHVKSVSFQDIILTKENLNLIFTSSYLQPYADSFDKTFKFVGPCIVERKETSDFFHLLDKKKKLIYISAGTIFNDNIKFFNDCIKAFTNSPYQIVISLGHRFTYNDLIQIPKNIIVRNYVPQLDVLKKADLFITHAGMNSMSESLYFGVPMIAVPQIHEQSLNAIRLGQLGASIYMDINHASPDELLSASKIVINTKKYYENATYIQKTLHDAGGVKKAVSEILAYIN